jgi:RNA polymerase subunit RPABC4/transcription elongation factor Spt4
LSQKMLDANKQKGYKRYQEYLKDNSIAWGIKNMQRYKKYFLEEQNHCCAICGMKDEWNGKQLVFILDHIDGNADNNNRDNLRLVCPNCDSQLDTFKSKNKKSARATWYKKEENTEEEA